MTFNKQSNSSRPLAIKSLLVLGVLLILNGVALVPTASAQVPCPAITATTGPIDLLGCEEYKPGNSSSTNLTIPAGLAVNDLLIAIVQTDDGGTDADFTMDPYWSTYGPETSAGSIESQIYYRVVLNPAETGTVTNISWNGGNERFYALVLHFRGASADFDPDVGVVTTTGNDSTPPAPAFTTEVDNTLVLRTLSLDRSAINEDVSGLNAPLFTDIALDNTGNGNGGISGGAAYREEPLASTLVAQDDWQLTGGRPSHTRTFGIRPAPEFRFSMSDTTSSVCGVQSVTLSAVDADGNVLDWYTGTVDLSIVASSSAVGATWSEPGAGVPGILTNGVNGAGTFQFVAGDNGTTTLEFYVPTHTQTIDFNVVESSAGPNGEVYGESPDDGDYTSPTLTILNCEFVISYDDNQVETCAMESTTITLQDTNGDPANFYTGTLTINNGSGGTFGNYTQTSGSFVLNNGTADDGIATYPFVITPDLAGTPNVLVLDYVHGSNSLLDVDLALSEDSGFAFTESGNPLLSVESCVVIVTLPDADLTRDTCSMTSVTFEVQAAGATVTNFAGDINLSAAVGLSGQGFWFDTLGNPGTLSGGGAGDGTAAYDFNGTEGGSVTLDFRNAVVATGLTFEADGITDDGITLTQSGAIPSIDIGNCTLTITTASVSNIAEVCRGPQSVTYTLTSPDARPVINYNGTVSLSTTQGVGDYAEPGGGNAGTLNNLGFGAATYEFDPTENGVFTLEFSLDTAPLPAGVLNLQASLTGASSVTTDATLTWNDCVFEIAFLAGGGFAAGVTDVCSIKQVQITLVDSTDTIVDDYTGQIFLSTSTGFGSWALSSTAQGSISDSSLEDGQAAYTFNDDSVGLDDNGTVILDFTHTGGTAGSMNVNVTDLVTSDLGSPGDPDDPLLQIDACYFEISFDGGTGHGDADSTACEVQQVTIEVYNSLNVLATDYAGRIDITTDTDNGDWADNTVTNSVVNGTANDGAASYTFDAADGGDIVLDYSNLNAEEVNFDITDFIVSLGVNGTIEEDGAADPSLDVGSCIPAVAAQSCASGGSPLLIPGLAIDAQNSDPSLQGRKIVVATMHEVNALTGNDVTNVEIDTDTGGGTNFVAFAEILETTVTDNFTLVGNLWTMREATGLPTAAGSYEIRVTHTDDNLAACAFYLTDVEQVTIAKVASPDEDTGPLNDSIYTDDGSVTTATTITTTQNNALILSVGGQGTSGGDWDGVSPSPPLSRLFNGPDPGGSTFGGSSGNLANAAAVTVGEIENGNTFRVVHMVAAFNPIITGPPVAVDYVPVTLFETYAGNISYRAIGGSFLSGANGSACNFIGTSGDPSATSSATLTLPDEPDGLFSAAGEFDSDIQAAFLYWFASGSFDEPFVSGNPGITNGPTQFDGYNNVDFTVQNGLGGTSTTTLSATEDELFLIENAGVGGDWDFYAAYKDVTGLMVGTNNEQTVGVMGHTDENPNGTYTVSSISWDDRVPWDDDICVAGWSLVVIYENPYEQLRVANLFHGFQPFQNSSFTLVPRNFRMAERNTDENRPNGQITHVTVEGDTQLSGPGEGLTLQVDPANLNPASFAVLETPFNPEGEEFNGTITRPVYSLIDIVPGGTGGPDGTGPVTEYAYIFDNSTDGDNNPSNGYEIDFPILPLPVPPAGPPYPANETTYADSFGVDIDTHFIDGDNVGDPLYNFANPIDLAEEITSRYSAEQDLVLLVSEVISVTNDDIADIEVTITEADAGYTVGTTGDYTIQVTNNGSGGTVFGQATGYIELVGELPAGVTLASGGSEVTGTGWTCTDSVDSVSAFTCEYDIPETSPNWLDESNPSLPNLTATVTFSSPPTNFLSLNNNAKLIVRVQHQDDDNACRGSTVGVLPVPTNACRSPEFDNVNDLQGGVIDINDLEDKTGSNNNVDSITTNVKGVETDLKIEKSSAVLVESTNDVTIYTITVTNNGPDDITTALTQPTITVTDDEPANINFDSATGDIVGWACVVNAGAPDQLVCNFTGDLAAGASTDITVVGDVTGTSGDPVSNTATVDSGTYNFDIVPNAPGENSATDNTSIQATPPIISDRFLFSVSAAAAANTTSIGGLSNFTDNDIVFYNPSSDTASLFIDSQNTVGYNVDDPNALHLLPTGNVVLSPNTDDNSIGTGSGIVADFDKTDLVIYNRVTNTAQLLFDGSVIVDDGGDAIDANIDAVYVINDGTDGNPIQFVFSTAGPATGPDISWSDSDLVLYNGGTFSLYLDAEDDNVFDATDAQVDAAYIRVDPADAEAVDDVFVLSSAVATVGGDDNVGFGLDDIAEIDITGGSAPTPTATDSSLLFRGNLPVGIFTTSEPDLKLNALHLIEPVYLGHFEISEVVEGTACAPARLRIRKHLGTSHVTDTNFTGTIVLSTDTNDGIWEVFSGTPANLINNYTKPTNFGEAALAGDTDNGQAVYTFAASDNGEVILTLNVTQEPPMADSVTVSLTRGMESFVDVLPDDNDSPFTFNLTVQTVDYEDFFDSAAFNNNDGSAGWSADWDEDDYFDGASDSSGAGLATGNIQMQGGKLSLTANANNQGAEFPRMARTVGLGLFNASEPVVISYDYGYQNVSDSGDVIELQINDEDVDGTYITVVTYDSLDGSSGSDVGDSVDLSAIGGSVGTLLAGLDSMNPNLYVRWKITNGYNLGTFTVDNFKVATGTTACNITAFDHYHIDVPSNGLACVTGTIRIEGHDAFHQLTAPGIGTELTLTTDNGAGSWVGVSLGTGTLDMNPIGTGQGRYTFTAAEDAVELALNYTDPATDGATFNIDVTDGTKTELQDVAHDPDATWSEAGIAFYDQTNLSYTLPYQIAGKPSQTAPSNGQITLQLVRSVAIPGENAAAACESLVDDGDTITLDLVGVCVDPVNCDVASMTVVDSGAVDVAIPMVNGNTANPHLSGDPISLTFADLGLAIDGEQNIGATLNFTYPDAGKIRFDAQYELPLNDDNTGASGLSGNTINSVTGPSDDFIVRPFGFDIDFSDDRAGGGTLSLATDADGPAFARAGVGFNTTVSAVVWESADDTDNDGIPDASADLSNNAVTSNFDDANTTGITTNTVAISIGTDDGVPDHAPSGSTAEAGNLVTTGGLSRYFQVFSGGQSGPQAIAIDDVGIFDLSAQLVTAIGDDTPINYFNDNPTYAAAESIAGNVVNVGRIYPNNFELVSSSFGPRVRQMGANCSASTFTYLGEEFGINFTLEARNAQDERVNNYFGNFAKLNDFDELDIRAIIDVGPNEPDIDIDQLNTINSGDKLVNSTFTTDLRTVWLNGQLVMSGNMILQRRDVADGSIGAGGEEDPLSNVQIAFGPTDNNVNDMDPDDANAVNDVLLNTLDVDLDDGTNEDMNDQWRLIGTNDFRYGRLIVENSFGPETEDLEIPIRIEYFDGTDFVTNTLDNCTSVLYDVSAGTRALDFVAGSYDPPQPEPVGVDYLEPGDTVIEGAPGVDVEINVYNGVTGRTQDGDASDENDPDRPFFVTAPDPEGDDELSGRVLIELDLTNDNTNLTTPLNFLQYDWRTAGDLYDETPELSGYNDNPRGIVEFGSYRGHDKVINWQELFIAN